MATDQSGIQSPRYDSYANRILLKSSKWINDLAISHKVQGTPLQRGLISETPSSNPLSAKSVKKKNFQKIFPTSTKVRYFLWRRCLRNDQTVGISLINSFCKVQKKEN